MNATATIQHLNVTPLKRVAARSWQMNWTERRGVANHQHATWTLHRFEWKRRRFEWGHHRIEWIVNPYDMNIHFILNDTTAALNDTLFYLVYRQNLSFFNQKTIFYG